MKMYEWPPKKLLKQYNYQELLEHYADKKYQNLGDEEIGMLVSAYLSQRDDFGEDAIKDHTMDYHFDVLAAMAGRIDPIEFQRRLLKPVINSYKQKVIDDYEQTTNPDRFGKSEREECEDAFIR